LKKEVIAVMGDFIEEFSKSERELLWQEIKQISRQMLGFRGRRRSSQQGDDETLQLSDDEFIAKFEEAQTKLPQVLQAKLAVLPKDKAMLQLGVWLRRATRLEPSKLKQFGLNKGDLVLQHEWLDVLENKVKAALYQRLLSRARVQLERAILARWKQLQTLVSGPTTPEAENYLYDQLQLVVKRHQDFKRLPERVHRQVYGIEVPRTVAQVLRDKKSTTESADKVLLPLSVALRAAGIGGGSKDVALPKKAKKKAKKKKLGLSHTPPKPRPKRDKGSGPPIGEAVRKPSAAEISGALSLLFPGIRG